MNKCHHKNQQAWEKIHQNEQHSVKMSEAQNGNIPASKRLVMVFTGLKTFLLHLEKK